MRGDVRRIEPLLVVDIEHGNGVPIGLAVNARNNVAAHAVVRRPGALVNLLGAVLHLTFPRLRASRKANRKQ